MLRSILLLPLVLAALVSFAPAADDQKDNPLIPVFVTAQVEPVVDADSGDIPLTITIRNELDSPIDHHGFRLEPNEWNGETANVSVVDIYRDGVVRGLYLARPEIDVPREISGMGRFRIESGETLTIRTDARKWTIADGWKPGRYKINVRVDGISADDGRCFLSVYSDPVEFELK